MLAPEKKVSEIVSGPSQRSLRHGIPVILVAKKRAYYPKFPYPYLTPTLPLPTSTLAPTDREVLTAMACSSAQDGGHSSKWEAH